MWSVVVECVIWKTDVPCWIAMIIASCTVWIVCEKEEFWLACECFTCQSATICVCVIVGYKIIIDSEEKI